ncbi:MAG TPA: DUF692 family protein [Tepidisphaeraceae bacterium]|nr:DUF692 family protein [Tepidisphaeraceae bacterium]
MQFTVNFSPEAAQLFADKRIHVDRFKCPDWPDMIEQARALAPVYVHFPLDAGTISGRACDLDAVDAMARDTDTPFVDYHLVAYDRDFPDRPTNTTDPDVTETVVERAIADISRAADRFGAGRVILENIPYFGAGGKYMRASVDPAVLKRIIDATGCGFLLDLSHARIAAHYLEVDPHAYIESLPVADLRELHLTGVDWVNGKLLDHMPLGDEDITWTRWAVERIAARAWTKPQIVAFEYGGVGEPFRWRSAAGVIERDVNRLNEILAGISN